MPADPSILDAEKEFDAAICGRKDFHKESIKSVLLNYALILKSNELHPLLQSNGEAGDHFWNQLRRFGWKFS